MISPIKFFIKNLETAQDDSIKKSICWKSFQLCIKNLALQKFRESAFIIDISFSVTTALFWFIKIWSITSSKMRAINWKNTRFDPYIKILVVRKFEKLLLVVISVDILAHLCLELQDFFSVEFSIEIIYLVREYCKIF